MRILNPEILSCFVVDEFLGRYLTKEKNIPSLMIRDGKYFFSKGGNFINAVRELPIVYRFCKISEMKGGANDKED